MSFVYPRTIAITRRAGDVVRPPGVQDDYQGVDADAELVVLTALPASIQQTATAGGTPSQLPADARAITAWRIFIPLNALRDPAAIRTWDHAIDDLGRRFNISAAYPNSLGTSLLTELVEA